MFMTPFIVNLLLAMFLGALIGAERQWRQRMAGLRTNALVATGAAVFILSSMNTSPDSPGRIAAQIVSGIGFLGAGVIMREGMNIRGLNTAATLWCSAGIGVLCGLGQHRNAIIATLVILCANILLREAAQRIHIQLPAKIDTVKQWEVRYRIQITCSATNEIMVRALLLYELKIMALRLQSLCSADITSDGKLDMCAEISATPTAQKDIEDIVCRVSLEKNVSAVQWHIAEIVLV